MIELTRIKKKRRGRTRLRFNTEQTLDVPSRVVNELDLEEGESYRYEQLREDVWAQCRELLPERARSHLARYTKTTGEFEEHFTRKGYPEEMVSGLVPQLREEGFLDDDRVAREHIQNRKRNKPRGKKKLVAELMSKGLDKNQARTLVDEEVSSEDERKMAREYCEKNKGLSRQKLARRLSSRGFPSHLIHDLLDEFASGDPM